MSDKIIAKLDKAAKRDLLYAAWEKHKAKQRRQFALDLLTLVRHSLAGSHSVTRYMRPPNYKVSWDDCVVAT